MAAMKTGTIYLAIFLVCAFIVWGASISLQPTFYPTEAEKRGATPSQVNDIAAIINTNICYLFRYAKCLPPNGATTMIEAVRSKQYQPI